MVSTRDYVSDLNTLVSYLGPPCLSCINPLTVSLTDIRLELAPISAAEG